MVSGRDRPYGGRCEVTCRDCAPASADRMGSAHVVVGCGHGCASPGRCHRGRLAAGRTRRHHGGRSPANPDRYRGADTLTVPTEGGGTDTRARPDTGLAAGTYTISIVTTALPAGTTWVRLRLIAARMGGPTPDVAFDGISLRTLHRKISEYGIDRIRK